MGKIGLIGSAVGSSAILAGVIALLMRGIRPGSWLDGANECVLMPIGVAFTAIALGLAVTAFKLGQRLARRRRERSGK